MLPAQAHRDFKTGIENDWHRAGGAQLGAEKTWEWKDCDVEGFWKKQTVNEDFFLQYNRKRENALESGRETERTRPTLRQLFFPDFSHVFYD